MPFVRISVKGSRSEKERLSIGDSVDGAMVTAIGIPEADRFQVITRSGPWSAASLPRPECAST
jgi:hypothetical protein